MNLKKFIEKFTSAPVNEKKVAEIVKVYGVELPEDVQHFVSACGKNPLFIEDDQVDADFRVLSFDEIVDAEEDLDTDFKSMNMMPLIDFYDNQFVVYKFDEQCWAMYSFDDDSTSDEYPSLNDFLLNFYDLAQSEDCDVTKSGNSSVDSVIKAAEQGDSVAQNKLGYMYRMGYGVPQSDANAAKWYRKAAEQGNASAQVNIGNCFFDGRGVERNYNIAREWYEKSAAQGNSNGLLKMGYLYYNGIGVEQDYKKALEAWLLAAKEGDENAMCNIGVVYYKGHGVELNKATAVEWFKKAALNGYTEAMFYVGSCYEEGEGVEKDLELAVSWYREAAEQGDNDAVEALARLGKTGNAEEVPVNETPAQNEEVEKLPSVCFTGACPGYTRAELSDLVEGKYVVKDSVTKDLDILVCADPNSGSSKLQKAAKNGVRIMSYDDFLAIIGEDDEEGDEQRQIELTKKVLDDIRKNTMKPLLRLKLTKKPVSLFESKVGGLPYLPNKEAVPFDANGCPLRMVAQIDCKELSYLPDYPQTGLMQFWVGQDEVYGLDIDGGARVVWYETIDETVTDDMVRAWLDELPQPEDDEDFPIQDEFAISFSETQEPMSLLDNNFTDIFTEKYNELSDDEPIDDYDELSEEAHSLIEDFADSDGHKIGGYPAFCQDDPRNENQTVVLLQIDSDSDNDIWWGDSGVCGFFCTPEELKKRDFSNVLYNWDCY